MLDFCQWENILECLEKEAGVFLQHGKSNEELKNFKKRNNLEWDRECVTTAGALRYNILGTIVRASS